MPKQKKPPKNAYYFFMVDRKRELEAQGYRFPGGMRDVASAVHSEWKSLAAEDKKYFDDLAKQAKEEEKYNTHNKFTATGESFAHVQQRHDQLTEEMMNLEAMVDALTIASPASIPGEKRNFIFIRIIHSCEVLLPDQYFCPLELGIAVFSLEDGLKCQYWTLIDTVTTPVGYASATKETSSETGLPQPGSSVFEPKHRDYKKIFTNVKSFVEKFLANYESNHILFAMESEFPGVEGCLKWLMEHANEKCDREERLANEAFFNGLKYYKLPRLLLKFATMAKKRNPSYNNVIACISNLERTAEQTFNIGRYDYKPNITCSYHLKDEPSYKMNMCAKSVVLRRIYLLLEEIAVGMKLPWKVGHDIEKFVTKDPPPGPPAARMPAPFAAAAASSAPAAPVEGERDWGTPRPINRPPELLGNEFPSLGESNSSRSIDAMWGQVSRGGGALRGRGRGIPPSNH
jgi:hypothetical protein